MLVRLCVLVSACVSAVMCAGECVSAVICAGECVLVRLYVLVSVY